MPDRYAADSRTARPNIALVVDAAHLRRQIPVERRNLAARETLVRRILAEFEEMPGLCVTLLQATRLCGLPQDAVSRILLELIAEGSIRMTPDGQYSVGAS